MSTCSGSACLMSKSQIEPLMLEMLVDDKCNLRRERVWIIATVVGHVKALDFV